MTAQPPDFMSIMRSFSWENGKLSKWGHRTGAIDPVCLAGYYSNWVMVADFNNIFNIAKQGPDTDAFCHLVRYVYVEIPRRVSRFWICLLI